MLTVYPLIEHNDATPYALPDDLIPEEHEDYLIFPDVKLTIVNHAVKAVKTKGRHHVFVKAGTDSYAHATHFKGTAKALLGRVEEISREAKKAYADKVNELIMFS